MTRLDGPLVRDVLTGLARLDARPRGARREGNPRVAGDQWLGIFAWRREGRDSTLTALPGAVLRLGGRAAPRPGSRPGWRPGPAWPAGQSTGAALSGHQLPVARRGRLLGAAAAIRFGGPGRRPPRVARLAGAGA